MKISIPDVNLLFALVSAGHPLQNSSVKWMDGREADSVAICRVTQMGLLRLLTNAKAVPGKVCSIPRAWEVVNELMADKRVFFESEPPDLEEIWVALTKDPSVGPSSWTDAYLAAFAQGHGYEMVTFDRGFRRWGELTLHLLV